MALARKGARTLTIDDARYRWTVSPDDGFITIVVERASDPRKRLCVQTDHDDHRHASVPGSPVEQGRSITPGTARAVVLAALARGWDPGAAGPPSQLRLQGEELIPWTTGRR